MVRTERLELRLDGELLERLDEWIQRTGRASSRSDAVRQLVDIGLATATGKAINLTDGDKLNFMLLRDIAKHLKVDTETNVDFMADAIYGGHYWGPVWEMSGLFHQQADRPADVSFVVDVLDVWSFVEERLDKATPEELETVKAAHYGHVPNFSGFDGNEESELLSIARFLVEKMNRFSRFKGRGFDSHTQVAPRYRRMVGQFKAIRPTLGLGRDLSIDQVITLVKS